MKINDITDIFNYFIVYQTSSGNIQNTEYQSKYINSIDDIKQLEDELKQLLGCDTITIINYRMF